MTSGDVPGRSSLPVFTDDLVSDRSTGDAASILDREIHLSELLDVTAFRDVCASFVDLYKIGLKIFDKDGTKLVDIRVGNGDWCGYIFSNPTGRSMCTALVTKIKQFDYPGLETGEVVEQTCFSGLKYVIMPITYGGDLLGRVIYGPFMPAKLDKPGEDVERFGEGFEPQRLWSYGEKIRRAPDEMIMKILTNFRRVVDTVTFIAMKAHMTQQLHLESITASYNDLSVANRQLRESFEKLKELDKLKSNFLAMISHELRTPLTSVIGYSEMLIEGLAGDMSEEQQKYVSTIKDKGEALLELIGSLLDMSKIEAGAMRLTMMDVTPRDLLESAMTYVVPQAQKKKINLEIEVDPKAPVFRGDPDKLRQCIVNLVGNAVKFTPEGGSITLAAALWVGARQNVKEVGRFGTPEERFVRLEVRDTGIGIAADKLERVFSSFYQVDNSITREYGGTGLGLAIVKRFIEGHNGEIQVQSTEGQGTTFALLVPLGTEMSESVDIVM